ncbi:uncharacterized protein LOC121988545 [Zingiber officinale]|uniref:Uncharacterized protein n=1 Tax=Zingiber officinale TaxID=94328 RepID=A0A8J5L0I2_ZINOF|nr:uncharacterized protein LOC121988545 [Zingiber officinale]XP_042397949.1 uncharacterized protein LOC121988545 [Zingiber officinale]KAG6496960.1 hypothetical protein ZIOFF_044840 [Zingiber officinale]
MASALLNSVTLSPPPTPTEAFAWLGPRISFSDDATDPSAEVAPPDEGHPDASPEDFEFRLHDDPVSMLAADELFSEGKLVPLQMATPKMGEVKAEAEPLSATKIGLPDPPRKAEIAAGADPYACSPRAPRCASRWREFLGFKRARAAKSIGVQAVLGAPVAEAARASVGSRSAIPRSALKHLLLHRQSKTDSLDASLRLPLLRDSDHDSAPVASRLSHSSSSSSSSSSGPDHEDLVRLSIDTDKPRPIPPRVRLIRPHSAMPASTRDGLNPSRRAADLTTQSPRGVSVESPRMSSSGKIVFQGLERSSSSPGSFTGGPRPRQRGVERSYSANVRVAPVLNVLPVGSLRGSGKTVSVFGLAHFFSSQQKKNRDGHASNRTEFARSARRHRRQDRHASPKIN